ncbi:hypothetical protein FOPG_20174 [Fusarium oxysporum f. sp. conglutinans race 2 54008]|uniref:Uncharacterized protein n=1 Tax=Fusarium oxysporum f. sp. conglutinans race 2 54008 TaxID=1089457 RepID=X0GIT4_FUSOX|nr:hypothetical protein FOPG_20174 [Fusarium oxysporum f. sp. conglutinans race 2 54008]
MAERLQLHAASVPVTFNILEVKVVDNQAALKWTKESEFPALSLH